MSRPALGGSERLPAKQQWALRLVDGHGSSVQIRARAGNTARATGTEAEVDEDLRATLYGRRSPVADDLGPVHRRQQRRRSLLRRPDGADLPSGPQRPFADRATFSPPAARRSCRCRRYAHASTVEAVTHRAQLPPRLSRDSPPLPTVERKTRPLSRRLHRRFRCLTSGHAVLPGGRCDRCGARRRVRRRLLGI